VEESGFEPLVPLATEMLIELARGITNPTRMLAVGDIRPVAAVVLTLRVGPAVRQKLAVFLGFFDPLGAERESDIARLISIA
jgi:hypothetical protein